MDKGRKILAVRVSKDHFRKRSILQGLWYDGNVTVVTTFNFQEKLQNTESADRMNGLCVGCGEGVCNRVKGIKGVCSLFEGLNTKCDTVAANGIKRVE